MTITFDYSVGSIVTFAFVIGLLLGIAAGYFLAAHEMKKELDRRMRKP